MWPGFWWHSFARHARHDRRRTAIIPGNREYHDDPQEIARFLSSKHFSIVEILPLEVNSPWNAFPQLGMLYAKNDQFGGSLS